MKKQILIYLIVLLLPCAIFARTPCYNGEENCWECGQDCTARFNPSTETFQVSGTGQMAELATDGQSTNVPWYSIRSSVKNITFEGSITSLSTYAFYGMSVENVTIPDSVTYIGYGAFYKCYSLKNVTIPDSVTTINIRAFQETNLDSIVVPDSVTYMEGSNFSSNPNLTSIIIDDGTRIGRNDIHDVNENLKIYCTGDLAKCKQNAPDFEDRIIKASTKQINGVTYVYDTNGKLCAKSGIRKNKRIYTIEEANAVTGTKNRVSITYR